MRKIFLFSTFFLFSCTHYSSKVEISKDLSIDELIGFEALKKKSYTLAREHLWLACVDDSSLACFALGGMELSFRNFRSGNRLLELACTKGEKKSCQIRVDIEKWFSENFPNSFDKCQKNNFGDCYSFAQQEVGRGHYVEANKYFVLACKNGISAACKEENTFPTNEEKEILKLYCQKSIELCLN